MVRAQFGSVALTYTRNDGWTGRSEISEVSDAVVAVLSDGTPRFERGYLSEYANAIAILTEALGPNGWEITSYDAEPIDPDVVY